MAVGLYLCLLSVANWRLILSPKLFQLARQGHARYLSLIVGCTAIAAWTLPKVHVLFVRKVLIGWYFWSAALSILAVALFLAGCEHRRTPSLRVGASDDER